MQDPTPDFRVLNLTTDPFNDAGTSYYHKSIGGYHGAKLRRYQELIDTGIQRDIESFARSMRTDSTPVLNMLNTRYVIVPDNNKQPMAFPNNNTLGNAWFVGSYKLVDNADAEIEALKGLNPRRVTIVDKKFADMLKSYVPGKDSLDNIKLVEYAPNALTYHYNTRKNGLAVFSEIYYPKGWNAYVDGQLTPHFRSNYVLRAMVLPAGEHKLVFKFEPKVYFLGEKISRISSGLLVIIVLLSIGLELRKTSKAKT
ncbi:MAG: YfhO family protein, partial [Bacteroidales bacterium]|jgi:hypothetical protein|nr:YfhO family protein [Bacteroidales bacterium]